MARDIETTAVEGGITIETTRDGAFKLRNALFSAAFDGRAGDDAMGLRAEIPEPTDSTAAVVVEFDRRDAGRVYAALQEAARVARSDDRDATARRLERDADRIAFALARSDD